MNEVKYHHLSYNFDNKRTEKQKQLILRFHGGEPPVGNFWNQQISFRPHKFSNEKNEHKSWRIQS